MNHTLPSLTAIVFLFAFATAALAEPNQGQTPAWEPCDYGDTYSCG